MKLFKPIFKHWSYLADFVVIVAGIVVALSLDAWWQDKQDRKLEHEYMIRLHRDFQESKNNLENGAALMRNCRDDAIQLLQVIHGERKFNNDSVKEWLYRSLYIRTFRMVDGTYKSLIQSGKLGLITNETLNSNLARIGRLVETNSSTPEIQWDFFNNAISEPFFSTEIGLLNIYSDGIGIG